MLSSSRAFRSLVSATLVMLGCATTAPRPAPVPEEASYWFHQAWGSARSSVEEQRARASQHARKALALAPDWVAPARFLDDVARAERRGPDAVGDRRAALAAPELTRAERARRLYLAGRLEGEAGERRFDHALAADPDLAWAHHGVAWSAFSAGDSRTAVAAEKRALERARDPFERATFSSSLALQYQALGDGRRAIEVLMACLADPTLRFGERAWIASQLARAELSAEEVEVRRRGYERALDLIRRDLVADSDLSGLVDALLSIPHPPEGSAGEIELALMMPEGGMLAPDDGLRAEYLAELRLREQRSPLAVEDYLVERSRVRRAPDVLQERLLLFAVGRPAAAVERWLEALPSDVLDVGSMPRGPRIARVVRAARVYGLASSESSNPGPESSKDRAAFGELGDALLSAGWFEEARAFAEQAGARGSVLARRARAGEITLDSIAHLVQSNEQGEARLAPDGDVAFGASPEGEDVDGLDDLLRAMGAILARGEWTARAFAEAVRIHQVSELVTLCPPPLTSADYGARASGPKDVVLSAAERSAALVASPRIDYGFAGGLVHPGPFFSAQDAELGRGDAGEPVPGFAAEFARLGRFALVGSALGQGPPDMTILRRVFVEWRSGEHLGRPWAGTVAWCEGTDLDGRAARAGARIGGAALHEGYWLDIDAIRADWARWGELRRTFVDVPGWDNWEQLRSLFPELPEDGSPAARVARALAVRGLEVDSSGDRDGAPTARTAIDRPMGEADRVRLAVLAERAQAGEVLGHVQLDEVVAVTSAHEQAHLCDRARFYPVRENLDRLFLFLASSGFSPQAVAQRLEYRAQLVALAVIADPRLALVDLLEAAEAGGPTVTPHASAYRDLLRDLSIELDRWKESDPAVFPEIDLERLLLHQWHRVNPERLRALAIRLAERRGLTG